RPRSKGATFDPRPEIPATSPNRARQPGTSQQGGSIPTGTSSVVTSLDVGPEGAQAGVDLLVAPLDLPDVVDRAGSFRREGGEEHRHPGPDVGRLHRAAPQRCRPADDGPVRVAE